MGLLGLKRSGGHHGPLADHPRGSYRRLRALILGAWLALFGVVVLTESAGHSLTGWLALHRKAAPDEVPPRDHLLVALESKAALLAVQQEDAEAGSAAVEAEQEPRAAAAHESPVAAGSADPDFDGEADGEADNEDAATAVAAAGGEGGESAAGSDEHVGLEDPMLDEDQVGSTSKASSTGLGDSSSSSSSSTGSGGEDASSTAAASDLAAPEQQTWYSDTPLDLVFSWYNHSDPARQELLRQYNPNGTTTYGTEDNRGELFLALASAQHYVLWARRAYIVVPPGQGGMLNLDVLAPALRQKVRIVEETEFIPAEFLPTFSSIVVESFLHRIPGIAEYFLYMMDDVFFGTEFTPAHAFSDTPGVANVFLMDWGYMNARPEKVSDGEWKEKWRWPFVNTFELLERTFGEKPPILGWHAGYMLTKSTYEVAWTMYGAELNRSATHRFRVYKPWEEGGDIVAHLLVEHTALRLGLMQLLPSFEVPWAASKLGPRKLPAGVKPTDKYITYANPICYQLNGLPKGMLARHPGEDGITFANFNKAQQTNEWGWKKLCTAAVDIIGDGFDLAAVESGCLCATATVGGACHNGELKQRRRRQRQERQL